MEPEDQSQRRRILLVEDQAVIALGQKLLLERYGYAVAIAANGQQAVDMVREQGEIGLVLMDIDLGVGMDGTEAARRILMLRDVPVLFLSTHVEPEIVRRPEAISSYGYVVKLSGITVLDASIKMAFKLHAAHQEL